MTYRTQTALRVYPNSAKTKISSVRVKFIIELGYNSKAQKDRISPLYGDKFTAMVTAAKRKKYLAMDYAALPGIRDMVAASGSLDAMMSVLQRALPESKLLELLAVAPLFNMAPPDLKAYLLMGMGLRNVRTY